MDLSLYDLGETYQKIMDLDLEEETITTMLSELETSVQEKAGNIAHVKRTMESVSEAIKKEENRLKDKRKAVDNRIGYLKELLFENMKLMKIDEIKTNTDTIYITGRDHAKVIDKSLLPDEYKQQIVEIKVDKRKLNTDVKTNDIAGVEKYRKEWVVIRWHTKENTNVPTAEKRF